MTESFDNVYGDARRAAAYAKLEFPGTYYLAYRDLPQIIAEHVSGKRAIDFGCGAGRSTRFIAKLGFQVIGVDISEEMIRQARKLDGNGEYRLINNGDLSQFPDDSCDFVLSAFTFDNMPSAETKLKSLGAIRNILHHDGVFINLVSSSDIYVHEWASFTTAGFPENRLAGSGDIVRIIMKDVDDQRPVEDILWTDDAYRDLYRHAGLSLIGMHKPLARANEPYDWISETAIAPWVIYVLKKIESVSQK